MFQCGYFFNDVVQDLRKGLFRRYKSLNIFIFYLFGYVDATHNSVLLPKYVVLLTGARPAVYPCEKCPEHVLKRDNNHNSTLLFTTITPELHWDSWFLPWCVK